VFLNTYLGWLDLDPGNPSSGVLMAVLLVSHGE